MIGLYPDCPGEPSYTLTSPVFDKITLHLDKRFYPNGDLTIETSRRNADDYLIKEMKLGEKQLKKYRISHKELINAGKLSFKLKSF